MKENRRDILAERPELKDMPYSVPEGYFNSFKAQMKPYGKVRRPWKKMVTYVSAAASVVLLVGAGITFSQRISNEAEFTQEDFFAFSGSFDNAEYYDMSQLADAEIADEDIIDYLIYSGISAEEIELLK